MTLKLTVLAMTVAFGAYAHAEAPATLGAQCSVLFASQRPVKTSDTREQEIQQTEAWQTSLIDGTMIGHADTPPFYFEAEEGQASDYTVKSEGMHGDISHIEVTELPADGILRGTLMLPVSGHTGIENARKWAKQDTFTIYMQVGTGEKGDQFASYNDRSKLSALAENVPSTDLITRLDIAVPMFVGQQVRLLYFRSGSGGPGGYEAGRLMTLSWDGSFVPAPVVAPVAAPAKLSRFARVRAHVKKHIDRLLNR